jgi:hypothetical protein
MMTLYSQGDLDIWVLQRSKQEKKQDRKGKEINKHLQSAWILCHVILTKTLAPVIFTFFSERLRFGKDNSFPKVSQVGGGKSRISMGPESFYHIVWLQLNETDKVQEKEEMGKHGFAAA